MRLAFHDHRADPAAWAKSLGISREAVDLYLASEVIDLHVDSFIWTRVFGYDLRERHDEGLLGAHFYSQVDFPRILEAQVSGATWVITTNPARPAGERRAVFRENYRELLRIFDSVHEQFAVVRTAAEYRAARAAGKHAAFVGVQGGNALDATPDALDDVPDQGLLRVTVVHLTSSGLGRTSTPIGGGEDTGLSQAGRDYVRHLQAKKIFVDLAHVSRQGFFDALEEHDRSQPVLVTHTGVSGVLPHWRNLDDEQIKAVADLGGTIGIIYQGGFIDGATWGGRLEGVVRHLEHVRDLVGDDFVSLGSDWDGMICTPRDMPTILELPRLADHMLGRGWKPESIQKVLGKNALRVIEQLRG